MSAMLRSSVVLVGPFCTDTPAKALSESLPSGDELLNQVEEGETGESAAAEGEGKAEARTLVAALGDTSRTVSNHWKIGLIVVILYVFQLSDSLLAQQHIVSIAAFIGTPRPHGMHAVHTHARNVRGK